MDPLVEIPEGDLPKMRDLLRVNWPSGLVGHRILSTRLSSPKLTGLHNSYKFYSPGGDISHGMIVVGDQPSYFAVYICPTDDKGLDILEKALADTNVIDWNREVYMASVNEKLLACVKRLRDRLKLKITYQCNHTKHLLNKDSKPFEGMDPPANTYVGPLKPDHLDLVNRTWAYYSGEETYKHFESLMKNGLTFVLYSSDDHKPLSWVSIGGSGAFTHLYCVEDHRRKGYAEYIAKVAANDLLSKGQDVLAYTVLANLKPQKLFDKLGFELLENDWWIGLTRDK